MKSLFFCSIFFLQLGLPSSAQDHNYIKNPAIGIHFIMDDFKTADYIRSNSLSEAFRNNQFANSKNLKSGLGISYLQGLSNHLDFSITLAGSYLDYTLHNGTTLGSGSLLLETDASLIGKMFTDKHLISPYFVAGAGGSQYKNFYGVFIPLGTGLQVNFSNEAYLLINIQYRIAVTNMVNDHFYYSMGVAGNILKKKRKKPIAHPVLPVAQKSYDSDKDSVPDSLDACPDVPGLKQFQGCPDRDGDGIPDYEDKCPTVPGVLKYHGCPVPDTDGDGINDGNDSCPTVPGVIKYHGCPIPDSDGDGINDDEDRCPTQPGVKESQGCPLVKKVVDEKIKSDAQKIYFETDSYKLLPKSYEPLDDVIKILKDDPNLKLEIEGYTDNIGSEDMNLLLSEKRARAVLVYLQTKGNLNIKRISAKGFGLSHPVAGNKTAKGRALNRRVELKLAY
jgi:OOP family OmpA-OmpF porin